MDMWLLERFCAIWEVNFCVDSLMKEEAVCVGDRKGHTLGDKNRGDWGSREKLGERALIT